MISFYQTADDSTDRWCSGRVAKEFVSWPTELLVTMDPPHLEQLTSALLQVWAASHRLLPPRPPLGPSPNTTRLLQRPVLTCQKWCSCCFPQRMLSSSAFASSLMSAPGVFVLTTTSLSFHFQTTDCKCHPPPPPCTEMKPKHPG